MTMKHPTPIRMTPLALVFAVSPAFPQTAPDAGQVLHQTQPQQISAPRPVPGIEIQVPQPLVGLPGGAEISLQGVKFSGNAVIGAEALHAVLGDVAGQRLDIAGLRGLANRITQHYRKMGYPFAYAFLPEQRFADGILEIAVIEGRYGEVRASGDEAVASRAQDFLDRLQPGSVIEAAGLERATLILSDQPGIRTAPVIKPGAQIGTGDLEVRVRKDAPFRGTVRVDNHGNRYTGEYRLRLDGQFDSPFRLGDQVTLDGLVSDEKLWLGSVGYSLPLGGDGWRANLSLSHTSYQLGKQFANLQAHGVADVVSAGLSCAVLRSRQSNLTLSANIQHKALDDRQDSTSTRNAKSSDSLPITASFNHRDALGGGGITYGAAGLTLGRLKQDAALAVQDAASGTNSRGSFGKFTMDIARLQATPTANLTLFGRFNGQWANKNLDSSEGFSLGGPGGVRAYPVGEGSGDAGWLAQLEARYAMGSYAPYVFLDMGGVEFNANPDSIIPVVANNTRNLSGVGVGVRYERNDLLGEVSLAFRTRGGAPLADTENRNPRLWGSIGYRF